MAEVAYWEDSNTSGLDWSSFTWPHLLEEEKTWRSTSEPVLMTKRAGGENELTKNSRQSRYKIFKEAQNDQLDSTFDSLLRSRILRTT